MNDSSEILEFSFEPSASLQLSAVKASVQLSSTLIGFINGQLLIVQPKMKIDVTNEDAAIFVKKSLMGSVTKVKFIQQHKIYTFESKILNYISQPTILLVLSYPEALHPVELRTTNRDTCLIPVRMNIGNHIIESHVVDINSKGCGCMLDTDNPKMIEQLKQTLSKPVNLELLIPGTGRSIKLLASLKYVTQEKMYLFFGIQFSKTENALIDELKRERIIEPGFI